MDDEKFITEPLDKDEKKRILSKSIQRVHRHLEQRTRATEFEKEIMTMMEDIEDTHKEDTKETRGCIKALQEKVAYLQGVIDQIEKREGKTLTIMSTIIAGLITVLIALISAGILSGFL